MLAELIRYPLYVTWQSQATEYLQRLESLFSNRILAQAFITDSKLLKKLSWQSTLVTQLHPFVMAKLTEEHDERQSYSLHAACSAHVAQLQSDASSKTEVCRDIKVGYSCKPYIHNCSNKHLRRVIAQNWTGFHWLSIETGRQQGIARQDGTCQMCNHRVLNPGLPADQFDSFDSDEDAEDPIENENHVIFACSGYAYARQLFQDLFSETISSVGQFLSQPNPNRVAKFLTWVKTMRLNHA